MKEVNFYLKEGDRIPVVNATLTIEDSGVNLSGADVKFAFRPEGGEWQERAASLVSAGEKKVRYEWAAGDTDQAGQYQSEFRITMGDGRQMTAPNGPDDESRYIRFTIFPRTPDETPVEDLFGALHHLLQDDGEISDLSLRNGITTMVRMGTLKGYALNATRTAITPAIDDPNKLALLLYKIVKSFVGPRPDRGSFRTRAFSVAHGSYAGFLQIIDEQIDELENGKVLFGVANNFGNWLLLSSGLDVYESGLAKLPCVTVPQTSSVYLTCGCGGWWPRESVY